MEIFTKKSLTHKLKEIRSRGWIETCGRGNDGGVGNTLEFLLGIEENNLPLPNAGEWELKGQRSNSNSLITLFHMEPSPRAIKFVPSILLPKYGWPHKQAGIKYCNGEMSFRQTIAAGKRTDRGFTIIINDNKKRLEVSFDHNSVETLKHNEWVKTVKDRVGLDELNPQPYWGFDDLYHKAGSKLHRTVYAIADRKKENKVEYFRYRRFIFLEGFSLEKLLSAIESQDILIDFDARTGHNHGTKFRLRQSSYQNLFNCVNEI